MEAPPSVSAEDPSAMKGTRVLVCLPFLTPAVGGGAFVLANILEPLAELGCDVQAVYFQERARRLIPGRFKSYLLAKRVGSPVYYLEYARIIFNFASILKRERPEVILCNAYQPFWIALIARKIAGIPAKLITQEQNNLTRMFQGARWGRLRAFLVRKLDPLADRIMVPAQGLFDHLVADFSIPKDLIRFVTNPIPLRRIREQAREPAGHDWFDRPLAPILLNVGVLADQKDQKTLLRAFASVRRTTEARCVLLGDGPLKAELLAEAGRLGIADDVLFLGFQENPFKFMARADVFVLSSRYEGFGLVLAEAMACGLPVVSTRCPYGPEEIITHGTDGLLTPPGDPEALARSVLEVLSNSMLRKNLVQNGLRRAEDFSDQSVAKSYAAVFRECLG